MMTMSFTATYVLLLALASRAFSFTINQQCRAQSLALFSSGAEIGRFSSDLSHELQSCPSSFIGSHPQNFPSVSCFEIFELLLMAANSDSHGIAGFLGRFR
jgi:hypothetical protein